MGAVGCDGDMARHIGTRSECASHQTQLGSGSSLAASAQPTQPPTPPWTDAGPDMLDRDGSSVCRVGGIGVGGVDNGGPTHLRLDLWLELWAAMGGTLCAWSVLGRAVACSRAPAGCVRCAVAGPHCLAPATAAPRTHDITHTATDQRCRAVHTSTRCGRVDMGCGCGVWGVGLAAQHRRAPPPHHTCPRQSSPPPRAAGAAHILSGLSRLTSHAAPLESRFSRQRLALALSGGGDKKGVCDVTEACGLGRGGPEGVWVAAAATPRPGRPRPPPPAPRHHRPTRILRWWGILSCRRARSGRQQHRDGRTHTCPGWCSAGHATTPQGPPPPRAQCQQGQTRHNHTQAAPDAPQQCTRGGSHHSAGACGQSRPHAPPRHHRPHPARRAQAGRCTVQLHHTATAKVHAQATVPGVVGITRVVTSHSKLATRRHLPIRPDTDHTHAACMCHTHTVP